MAEEMNEKQVYDAHTKEIDLVNRDPKHLNDDVVKVRWGGQQGRDVPRGDADRAGQLSSVRKAASVSFPVFATHSPFSGAWCAGTAVVRNVTSPLPAPASQLEFS